MTKCKNCSKKVDEMYDYCPYCDSKIESKEDEIDYDFNINDSQNVKTSYQQEPQWVSELRKQKRKLTLLMCILFGISFILAVAFIPIVMNIKTFDDGMVFGFSIFFIIVIILALIAGRSASGIIRYTYIDGKAIAYKYIMKSEVYVDGVLYDSSFRANTSYINLKNGKKIVVIPLVKTYYRGGCRVYDVEFQEVVDTK